MHYRYLGRTNRFTLDAYDEHDGKKLLKIRHGFELDIEGLPTVNVTGTDTSPAGSATATGSTGAATMGPTDLCRPRSTMADTEAMLRGTVFLVEEDAGDGTREQAWGGYWDASPEGQGMLEDAGRHPSLASALAWARSRSARVLVR